MRTKHLLTAMVLPALFAACTNDDFVTTSQNAETLNGRKLAGDVTLSFSTEDDASTRLAYNGRYVWQENDQIGACLMDVINDNYGNPAVAWSEQFNLVNYIQTNYKFTRDAEGNWNTEAKLCEGNYFFSYPYNANMGVREAYKFDAASQVITNTTNEGLFEAYAKNNAFVGYGDVRATDEQSESMKIDMVTVFGSTGIKLKNTGTNKYTIEKIVLHGSAVLNSATVNPTDCDPDYQNGLGIFNVAQYIGDAQSSYYNPYASGYSSTKALRDVIKYENNGAVEVTIEGGNVLGTQDEIRLIVMVGENSISTGTAFLDIYTDKGMIKDIDLSARHYSTNDNVITDVALTKIGNSTSVEVTFDDTSISVPSELDINNASDLASLIHWNANTATNITANLNADVEISKAMYDELAASKIGTVTLSGAYKVTIAEDAPAAALNRFDYTRVSQIIVKGTQTLSKNPNALVTVEKDATLNVSSANDATVNNYGVLNVNGRFGTANNYGEMTIAAGRTVKMLTNYSTVTNAGIINTLDNQMYNNIPAVVTNTGNVVSGYNYGTIYNNAGEIFLMENTHVVYANGVSATKVNDNGNGSIVITDLEEEGNYKTGATTPGAIVQEIESASTTDVDTRANTVWLTGTLTVDPNLNAAGKMQTVYMPEVTVYAKSANAKISGNGTDQGFQLGGITIDAGATLVINKASVNFKTKKDVVMNGVSGKKATLTINSNAKLGANADLTAAKRNSNNVINDYSK